MLQTDIRDFIITINKLCGLFTRVALNIDKIKGQKDNAIIANRFDVFQALLVVSPVKKAIWSPLYLR